MLAPQGHRKMTSQKSEPVATRTRRSTPLGAKLEKKLAMYAAAAAGATGALVSAAPAYAEIVYTPAHVVLITRDNSTVSSYKLDLNHDGINDFSLRAGGAPRQSGNDAYVLCQWLATSNAVWGRDFRSALRRGTKIGPNGLFNHKFQEMGYVSYVSSPPPGFYGPWVNSGKGVRDRYLGLKFVIKGKVHYGWARLDVKVKGYGIVGITATLTGYAYETVPNKPIIAGKTRGPDVVVEPATLGRLAGGAAALAGWRAKSSATAAR
jgi:hypothetical protein